MRRYCHPGFSREGVYQEVDFVVISVLIEPSSSVARKGRMRPIQHFICQAFTLAELITIGEQIMRVEPSGRGCTNRPYMHAKQSIHAAIIPRCLSIISAAIPNPKV